MKTIFIASLLMFSQLPIYLSESIKTPKPQLSAVFSKKRR